MLKMLINKNYKISITLICILLGMLLVAQFRITETQKKDSLPYQRLEIVSEKLNQAEREKEILKQELKKLQKKDTDQITVQQITRLKMNANMLEVSGPGIVITLNDSKTLSKPGENQNPYLIHDEDLLKTVNELRAAGAEALSLNDERIIATSEIRCAGPTVSVNNKRSSPPYVIKAIGNPKTLEAALNMRGGIVENLKVWGIQVSVKAEDEIVIKPYEDEFKYKYAKANKKGDN